MSPASARSQGRAGAARRADARGRSAGTRTKRREESPAVAAREGAHVIEMQRRRLLLAMRELAGEVGLGEATVGAVCKRSRISRRTFYDQFEDRDACFLAAFEQALEEIAEWALPAWEQTGSWRERVRAGLEALLVLFDEQQGIARLCVIEAPKGGPAVLARRRKALDTLAAAVDKGRAQTRASDPPALTAESTVGGVLAVIHARLLESTPQSSSRPTVAAGSSAGRDGRGEPLLDLLPSLMAMIVLPYLGQAAVQRELKKRPATAGKANGKRKDENGRATSGGGDPFRDLKIRFTYRTARVLEVIAAEPGASNRRVGDAAGAPDQGQMSKLLKRLERAGLVENGGAGRESGEPNAWRLTRRGEQVHTALGTGTS